MNNDIGREFMRLTGYPYLPESPQSQGLPQPPLELPCPPDIRRIHLPAPAELNLPALDLRMAIEQRTTIRKYRRQSLLIDELSLLLWLTQGVKQVTKRPATLRTVPSAGARHAFETYLLINQVEGLVPGLYRYIAIEHTLIELNLDPEMNPRLTHACHDQQQIFNSAVSFFWVAVVERMVWRYSERGYRYMLLDAGHVCQNLYLVGEAMDCGVCAIDAYEDDLVNETLGLDGQNLFTIYCASLGKKLQKENV